MAPEDDPGLRGDLLQDFLLPAPPICRSQNAPDGVLRPAEGLRDLAVRQPFHGTRLNDGLLVAGRDWTPLFMSAQTGEGTEEVVERALAAWRAARADEEDARRRRPAEPIKIEPRPDSRRYEVQKLKDGSFQVRGRQVETFIEMMDMEEAEVREEAYRWLSRRGVSGALRKAGLEPGDRVRVGRTRWTWEA